MSHILTNTTITDASLFRICLIFFGDMLLISPPRSVVPWHERYLFLGWTLFSMIIYFSYQATMVEHLVASDLPRDINSMQELADSDLKVVTFIELAAVLNDIAALENASEFYKRLAAKTEISADIIAAKHRVAYDRDAALLFVKMMCKVFQAQMISENPRRLLTHTLADGPPSRFSALMVPKRSPFKDRFNEVILWIWQTGLIQKWTDDTFYNIDLKILTVPNPSDDKHDFYTMKDLSFIFLAWSGCCAVCCLVFVCEVLFERVKVLVRYFRISS